MPYKKPIISFIILSTILWSIGLPALAQIQITSVTSPVNVGDTVTISGSGFGDTQGTKSVKFSAGPADPSGWLSASVISWSDSTITVAAPMYAMTGAIKVVSPPVEGVFPITIKPKVISATASTNSVTVRFDNYMDGMEAANPANYTLVSGGSTISLANAWTEFRGL